MFRLQWTALHGAACTPTKCRCHTSPMRRISLAIVFAALCGSVPAQTIVEGAVQRPDVRLHYRVTGSKGPYAIILTGGPGGSIDLLQPFADHLKDRFRCVMLEQRGTGRSKLDRYDEKTINFDAYIED